MTPISPQIQQFAALLRTQVAALKAPSGFAPEIQRKRGDRTLSQKPSQSLTTDAADALALTIQQISPDDPRKDHKVFRAFLESILLAEFGHGIANDPRCGRMIDVVQQRMEMDADLSKQIQEAVLLLTEVKK